MMGWLRWVHLFDWSVASVSEPAEFYHHRHRLQVVAYQVVVQYNYHGTETVTFPVGDYVLFVNSRSQAYNQAMDFYNKIRARIKKPKTR